MREGKNDPATGILGGANSGRLEIEYASSEDLDRITRLILEGL